MSTPGPTTPDALHRPTLAARCAVLTAIQLLPSGPSRARYRQEFLADLHFIDTSTQLRYSAGILLRAWALRRALTQERSVPHDALPTRALLCRLNLHHEWRTARTEDGARYRRCHRCGKDHPSLGHGPGDWAGGLNA